MDYMTQLAKQLGVGNNEDFDVQEVVSKALSTTALSAGSAILDEQADAFINEVVNESKMLSMARLERKNSSTGKINLMNITGNVTEQASEGTDSGNTISPSFSALTYNMTKLRSAIDLNAEALEDNIAGQGLDDQTMAAILDKVATDLEELAWEGDESIVGTDANSRLLKSNDGWLTLLTAANGTTIVDGANKKPSYILLSAMYRNLPRKWRRRKGEFRFFMNDEAAELILNDEAARATGLADRFRETGELGMINGIRIEIIPMIPADLSLTGTDSQGTVILLAQPQNFIYLVQREISVERERKPRTDTWEVTLFHRCDFLIERYDAIVRANNVTLDPTADYFDADDG